MTSQSLDIEHHVQRIERDGYTILERIIEPEFVDSVVQDLLRLEQERAIRPVQNMSEAFRTVRIYVPLNL